MLFKHPHNVILKLAHAKHMHGVRVRQSDIFIIVVDNII